MSQCAITFLSYRVRLVWIMIITTAEFRIGLIQLSDSYGPALYSNSIITLSKNTIILFVSHIYTNINIGVLLE